MHTIKKLIIIASLSLFLLPNPGLAAGKKAIAKTPVKKVALSINRFVGKFVSQKDASGRLWYINPKTRTRYFLRNEETIKQVVTLLKLKTPRSDKSLIDALRATSVPITQKDLLRFPMNKEQQIFDPLFSSVAYVTYDGLTFSNGNYADNILPLASLTKLMTAMVFLDAVPDWEQKVMVTMDHILYPTIYVGDDKTSEIDLKAGEQYAIEDLWVALLVASSNQSAAILADASGLTRDEFINRMNEKAKEFGLTKTVFYDVAGLDSGNISTPKEMAIIAFHAFQIPKIAQTSVLTEYTALAYDANGVSTRAVPVINRNFSLLQFKPDGAKTGFLVEAQRNVAVLRDGRITVVMHARSMGERNTLIKKLLALR